MAEKGRLIVVSGPSGAGKSTVLSKVLAADHNKMFSVSATTREPRPGETDGVDYFFVNRERFEQMIADDDLLEYARYVSNYYGTPKKPVMDSIAGGRDVFFDIEVQGAMQIKKKHPEAILIFLIPPHFSDIESRLRGRCTETDEKVLQRLKTAREEYRYADAYDYVVINDDPYRAVNEINSIVTAEKCRLSERREYLSEVFLK